MSEDVEVMEPGGELLALLDRLDAELADREVCLEALAGYERIAATVAARQHELVARLDALRDPNPRNDFTAEELAGVLGITPETAHGRLDNAARVYTRLPATWRLLRDGRIGAFHAKLLADAIATLTDEQTGLVETYVLRDVCRSYRRWRERIRYAVHKYAPVDVEVTRKRGRDARTVWHQPGEDQTGTLTVTGPLDATMIAWTMIDDLAHKQPTDDRTVDQRRFDAFADLFLGEKAWDKLTPHIEVTVPLDTLQGGTTPGELVGYGPISAETARELAYRDTARWRRLVYAPLTGQLMALGEKTYRADQLQKLLTDPVESPPPPEWSYRASPKLRRFVQAQWRYCMVRGCGRRARYADLDHTKKYRDGGATSVWNLRPYCPRHHRMKDQDGNGWTATVNADGSTTIVDPTGHTYVIWPHDYRGP